MHRTTLVLHQRLGLGDVDGGLGNHSSQPGCSGPDRYAELQPPSLPPLGWLRLARCLVQEPRGTGPSPSRSVTSLPFARGRAWEPCEAGPRGRCEVESELRQAGSGSPVLSKDPQPLRDPRRLASIPPQRSLWLEGPDSWLPSRLRREPREAPTRVQGPRVRTRLGREVTLVGGEKGSQAAYREGAGPCDGWTMRV